MPHSISGAREAGDIPYIADCQFPIGDVVNQSEANRQLAITNRQYRTVSFDSYDDSQRAT